MVKHKHHAGLADYFQQKKKHVKVSVSMKHKESSLQQRCISHFRHLWPEYATLYFAVPNGVHISRTQAAIAKAEGLTAGVADTILMIPAQGYHALAIEFKTESLDYDIDGNVKVKKRTYQEPEQKAWQALAESQGYLYKVIRSREEFDELIDWYLGKRY